MECTDHFWYVTTLVYTDYVMVGNIGFEPMISYFQSRSLTKLDQFPVLMAETERLERSSPSLEAKHVVHYTTSLLLVFILHCIIPKSISGSPREGRTLATSFPPLVQGLIQSPEKFKGLSAWLLYIMGLHIFCKY